MLDKIIFLNVLAVLTSIIFITALYRAGRIFLWRLSLKGGDYAFYNKKIPVEIAYYDDLVGKFRVHSNISSDYFYASVSELYPAHRQIKPVSKEAF